MALNPIEKLRLMSGVGIAGMNTGENINLNAGYTNGANDNFNLPEIDKKDYSNTNDQFKIIFKKNTKPILGGNLGQLYTYNFSGSYDNANNSSKYSLSDYINNQKAYIQTSVYDLLNRKYGKGNYDVSKGWNQDAPTVEGWNHLQDEQGLNAYLKLMQDKQNLDLTSSALRSAESAKNQAYAEQDILRQQAEKYVPNQLRASGMGNVGTSESSRVGIYNQYARNLNDVSKETNNTIQSLVSEYQQAVNEGNTNLANQQISLIKEYQDVAYQNAQDVLLVLLNSETPGNLEEVREYIDSLENVLTSDQLNSLNIIYADIARSLQESKQEGETK